MEHTTLCNNTWLILWAILYITVCPQHISCRTLFMMLCAIQGSWAGGGGGAVLFLFYFFLWAHSSQHICFHFLIFLFVHVKQEVCCSSGRLNKRKSTWDGEETLVSLLTTSLLNHPSIPCLHLPPSSTDSTLKRSEHKQRTPVPSPTKERKAASA